MSVLFIVLPLALIIVIGALIAFAWATRSGQFDDLDTPAIRMLHDDVPSDRDGDQNRTQRDLDTGEPSATDEVPRSTPGGNEGQRTGKLR
jgi:cbb3-type cytochrome oxidase maturation protein